MVLENLPIEKPTRAFVRSPYGRSLLYGALLLVLGFLVFCWGTSYKVSLYENAGPGRAPAKLCTRASDDSKAEVERAVDGSLCAIGLLFVALVITPGHEEFVAALPRERCDQTRRRRRAFASPAWLRRPPPALYLLPV